MKQTILYLLLGIFLLTSCQQEEIPNAETESIIIRFMLQGKCLIR